MLFNIKTVAITAMVAVAGVLGVWLFDDRADASPTEF